jgi:triosephosphate isomerase
MAQHVDTKAPGKTTGWITPENLLAHGIRDAVLNHSERRVYGDDIVEMIKDLQSRGLNLIVCCESIEEAQKILEARPMGIAYETKELIGSGVSVTTKPEIIKEFVNLVKGKTMAFAGAGVTTGEDVKNAIELGCEGVILASAFAKAENHYNLAIELAEPFLG